MFVLELFILFLAGLFQDALNTGYVRAIAERATLRATVLSFLGTVLGFVVFARIFAHLGPDAQTAGGSILAYALGNSAGTWVGMRRPTATA